MSSSNTAVRMEHTASDLLREPPRPAQTASRRVRLRSTFRNRTIVTRDQGFRLFRQR